MNKHAEILAAAAEQLITRQRLLEGLLTAVQSLNDKRAPSYGTPVPTPLTASKLRLMADRREEGLRNPITPGVMPRAADHICAWMREMADALEKIEEDEKANQLDFYKEVLGIEDTNATERSSGGECASYGSWNDDDDGCEDSECPFCYHDEG